MQDFQKIKDSYQPNVYRSLREAFEGGVEAAMKAYNPTGEVVYSEEDMRRCFDAAREEYRDGPYFGTKENFHDTYPSFENYLSSLTNKVK